MADISKITLPDNSTYDIKDSVAREAIAGINSFEYIICTSAVLTPKGVTWKNGDTTITGTLNPTAGSVGKIYLVPSTNGTKDIYDEYITVKTGTNTYIWEMFGNTDVQMADLGALAKKDSASGSYTPAGTITKPSFTGTKATVNLTGTPSGNISTGSGTANYTPAGTLSGGAITVTPNTATKYVAASSTGGGSVTPGSAASCTLPSLEMSVTGETLSLSWSAGSFTANKPTAVTLPTFSSQTIATGIKSATISTEPTFNGTGAELIFTGDESTYSGEYTPAGSVGTPTFNGTAATITVS